MPAVQGPGRAAAEHSARWLPVPLAPRRASAHDASTAVSTCANPTYLVTILQGSSPIISSICAQLYLRADKMQVRHAEPDEGSSLRRIHLFCRLI